MSKVVVVLVVSLFYVFIGGADISIAIKCLRDKQYFGFGIYCMLTLMFATLFVKFIWLEW